LQLNESASGTLRANCTTNTFDLNGSVSVTDDYYNGWVAFNTDAADGKKYAFVTDYDYVSGSANTFTTIEDLGGTKLDWDSGDNVTLYRFFHEGTPIFDASTYPTVVSLDDGAIRICGGQSSTSEPIWVGNIDRTILSGAVVLDGTYASSSFPKRFPRTDTGNTPCLVTVTPRSAAGAEVGFTVARDEFIGVSPQYDNYQLAHLNYSNASATVGQVIEVLVELRSYLNKRITDIRLYSTKFTNIDLVVDLQFLASLPVSGFSFDATTQTYKETFVIDQTALDNAGNGWMRDSLISFFFESLFCVTSFICKIINGW